MYLKRIHMLMPNGIKDKHYSLHFDLHVYYIGYYLHRCLKQLKFETDGTYSLISIHVGSVSSPQIKFDTFFRAIEVFIPFDFERYDTGSEYERNRYYIELYEKALTIAAEHRPVPLKKLKECLLQLQADNFMCQWDFKNVSIKELGLKVKFTAKLTTYDFKLIADVYRKREPKPLCSGTVIRTIPDYIFFGSILKNITVKDGSIRIYAITSTTEFFYIPIQNLCEGKFVVKESMPERPEDKQHAETFYSLQRNFQYDNDDFR